MGSIFRGRGRVSRVPGTWRRVLSRSCWLAMSRQTRRDNCGICRLPSACERHWDEAFVIRWPRFLHGDESLTVPTGSRGWSQGLRNGRPLSRSRSRRCGRRLLARTCGSLRHASLKFSNKRLWGMLRRGRGLGRLGLGANVRQGTGLRRGLRGFHLIEHRRGVLRGIRLLGDARRLRPGRSKVSVLLLRLLRRMRTLVVSGVRMRWLLLSRRAVRISGMGG